MEDKRGKFVRLANQRVTKAIKSINLVGNLSNRNNYSYTEQDVKKILVALEAEIKSVRERFSSTGRGSDLNFRLDED